VADSERLSFPGRASSQLGPQPRQAILDGGISSVRERSTRSTRRRDSKKEKILFHYFLRREQHDRCCYCHSNLDLPAPTDPEARSDWVVRAHLDNNPENDAPENAALAHGFCNAVRSNEARGSAKNGVRNAPVNVRKAAAGVDPSENLVSYSEKLKARVNDWLLKRIGPAGSQRCLPVKIVERDASFDCGCSSVTLHRYLVNPGEICASKSLWRVDEVHLPFDKEGVKTLCVFWRRRTLNKNSELEDPPELLAENPAQGAR
jgi:hypothetical protein